MIIEQFRHVRNVGRFRCIEGSPDIALGPLTLIYSENGRGKTTLTSILRSLTADDPTPILERRRLSATDPTRVVVDFDGTDSKFDGAEWTAPGPRILVFDEHFVDANVHSGLAVDAAHRRNLHELVIGEEGVRFLRRVQELTEEIEQAQRSVREKQQAIPAEARGPLSVRDFCSLAWIDDVEEQLEEARGSVSVLQNAEVIRSASDFPSFALPMFDADGLAALLGATLDDIDQAALDAVSSHLADLGAGAEEWANRGVAYSEGASDCPYCGQDLGGSTLLSHYRAYFSQVYRDHRERIAAINGDIKRRFGGDQLASLQRLLERVREQARFWSEHIEVPAFSIDADALATDWVRARDEVLGLLARKSAAPLEGVALGLGVIAALETFGARVDEVRALSESLSRVNVELAQIREHAAEGSLSTAETRLAQLVATRNRFTADVDAACSEYLTAKAEKERLDAQKAIARKTLGEHRQRVFGKYEAAINKYLTQTLP